MTQPRVTDNDHGEITVSLDGQELRGWSYANDAEHRQKMLAAREYVEGWCDGLALGALPWAHIPKQYEGRWSFDYDEKRGFFVHCNGYGICQAEDSEICDAVCRAHNAYLNTRVAELAR